MRHGTQDHVAEPRESTWVPAWRTGGADAWQCHASPRGRMDGATWQCVRGLRVMGPRVSGPRWEYWGGNANALRCPTLYTRHFSLVFSVWDYSSFDFYFTWRGDAWDIQSRDLITCIRCHLLEGYVVAFDNASIRLNGLQS